MEGSGSLYLKDYEKFEVGTVEFKDLVLLPQWNILAVDQTFSTSFQSSTGATTTNSIVIYAAQKEHLILQLFRLVTHNSSAERESEDGSLGRSRVNSSMDEIDEHDTNRDLVPIWDKEKGPKTRDQYISLKLL